MIQSFQRRFDVLPLILSKIDQKAITIQEVGLGSGWANIFLTYSTQIVYKYFFRVATARMTDNNHEGSTQSSEDERHFQSNLRMIQSQHLTPEIAVNYLYKWRSDSKYIEPLLNRLFELCLKESVHYIPTIIYIMSLENNSLFEQFCEKVARQSLSHYLLVRWSYSTYLDSDKKKTEHIITKLDSCLLERPHEDASLEAIQEIATEKLTISNYTEHVNLFFEKMFTFPERLKKYQKPKRNEKLRDYVNRLSAKFMGNKCEFIDGIAFPINLESSVVVNILAQHCFTFSTKERVPFKLVVETISLDDARKIKRGKSPKYKVQGQSANEVEKEPFILPQTYFGSHWSITKKKIIQKSIFGKIASHRVKCYMVKSGDDLRQQYMAMQLITLINEIFLKENIKIWMKPYSIIPYSSDSGLIEFIDDTRTISYLKEMSHERSLSNIYKQIFGSNWQAAMTNFIQSLAGYSLIQYLFDIKDRHNNNILVDVYGHIIHIDFSFMLSSSPGNMNFQRAPFKLTQDYMDLMQGSESDIFQHFKLLFFLGLKYLRKYKKQIMQLIMMMTECKGMKCFIKFDRQRLESKFYENTTDEQLEVIVDDIIKDACNSYTTSQYDVFQWFTNKIEI